MAGRCVTPAKSRKPAKPALLMLMLWWGGVEGERSARATWKCVVGLDKSGDQGASGRGGSPPLERSRGDVVDDDALC